MSLLAVLAAALLFGAAAPAPAQERTNIVFIMADDLGWSDTSVYGSTYYPTPALAELARRGMVFTQAYAANPLCSPTRASVLTGQYPGRLRLTMPAGHLRQEVLDPVLPGRAASHERAVTPQTRTRLPLEYVTLAEALRGAGYRTAHFGKWHLGWDPYLPTSQGFDVNLPGGSYPGPPSYLSPYRMEGFPDGPPGEHIDDRGRW
ncbi:MAG TPA: sulfatase-like hydrolase/transferase [Solirubrobacterales bacterium]|nr:sulfatase-like hydrolase/transferase [Solirubrobacterales bacterium]